MKKDLQLLAVVALVGIFGFSSISYAGTPPEITEEEMQMIQKKREKQGEIRAKMKEKLGLTDEQQQKLEEHRNSNRGQAKQYFGSMKELNEKLNAELEKAEFDEATVRGIHSQLKTLKAKIADHRLEGILEVRKILTAEQFKKFHELKGNRKGNKRGDKSGKWGGRKGDHRKFSGEMGGE